MVGLTNPESLLIFSVIVPDFIDRTAGHDTLQPLTLGAGGGVAMIGLGIALAVTGRRT